MKRFAVFVLSGLCLTNASHASEKTDLVVQYAYGAIFDSAMTRLKNEFEASHPEIRIQYRAPYESYEDASQKVMREAIINRLPDITMQGINQVRPLVERNIAVDITPFIEQEDNLDEEGYYPAMLDLGRFDNGLYGLPFAFSLPAVYYNVDLMEKAGGEGGELPQTWDKVLELAERINYLPESRQGIYYDWDITGNWLLQAPILSQGGQMASEDEQQVSFNDSSGEFALNLLSRMVLDGGMTNMGWDAANASFVVGNTGIVVTTIGRLESISNQVGDLFTLRTGPFPDVKPSGGLPAGGTTLVMLTKDAERQQAAWEFIKFATGSNGATIVVEETGYVPPNMHANTHDLQEFYAMHSNRSVMIGQLPLMLPWYSFPGGNALRITDVIKSHLESIVTGSRVHEPRAVLEDMAHEVQLLMPQ